MKVFQIDDDEGHAGFVFATREAAIAFAGDDAVITEREVHEGQPPTWTYWTRGADVYPDGVVIDWVQEHTARGEMTIPAVDDHLNARAEPWDGHTQGHCGEHVCIHGTDRAGVEAAYERAVAAALARQDGKCHSKYAKHDGDIDGETVYEAGFLRVRRRGDSQPFQMDCYPHFAHDWPAWSEWHRVDSRNWNRSRVCRRCTQMALECRFIGSGEPTSADAVDPHAASTGTLTTRVSDPSSLDEEAKARI